MSGKNDSFEFDVDELLDECPNMKGFRQRLVRTNKALERVRIMASLVSDLQEDLNERDRVIRNISMKQDGISSTSMPPVVCKPHRRSLPNRWKHHVVFQENQTLKREVGTLKAENHARHHKAENYALMEHKLEDMEAQIQDIMTHHETRSMRLASG